MIKDLRNTFKQTAIYGTSNILVKAAGLILLPIYTNSLSLSDYGVLVMFEVVSQFFTGVISLSVPTAMLRLGSDSDKEEDQNKIFFTALVFLIGLVGIFWVVFLPMNGLFSQAIFDTDKYAVYFTVLFWSVGLEVLGMLPMQLLRLKEQSSRYLFYFALKLLALVGLVWYFVSVRDMGVYGALWGIALANGVLLVATAIYQLRHVVPVFDRKAALDMFHFGAPLVFTTVSSILLTIADRVIIKLYGPLDDVGTYGLAYKIGSLSNLLIIGSFALGFLPVAFKKFGEPNFDRFFGKTFTYFIGITALLTLLVSVFSKEFIKLMSAENPDYWLAIVLVPFIAYAFIFKAVNTYMAYVFLLIKRTRYHAVVTVFGVVLNVGLNFLLIPRYGMYGAIGATAASYLAMASLTYRLAQPRHRVNYEFSRIVHLLIATAVFIAPGIALNDMDTPARIALKTTLTAAFGLYVYWAVADKTERGKVRKAVGLMRRRGLKGLLREFGKD